MHITHLQCNVNHHASPVNGHPNANHVDSAGNEEEEGRRAEERVSDNYAEVPDEEGLQGTEIPCIKDPSPERGEKCICQAVHHHQGSSSHGVQVEL